MSKTILITGSNGLLGQKIVHALLPQPDIAVIATSKGANRISSQEGYRYESMDITAPKEVAAVLEEFDPDVIINTAAMTNVDACESNKEGCQKLNVDAVDTLSRWSSERKTHLIHLSTDFVFDGKNGPYREEDPPSPLSTYAESKLESEKIVKKMTAPWTIIRTILIYGTTENMSRSNFVLWAKESFEQKKKIRVVDDQFRSPTLAEDLAAGCIQAALREATGIYHLSGPEKDLMSIFDLVQVVADVFHLDGSLAERIKSDTLRQEAKRPAKTGFILDKARKALGYEPHRFREGLEILKKQLASTEKN